MHVAAARDADARHEPAKISANMHWQLSKSAQQSAAQDQKEWNAMYKNAGSVVESFCVNFFLFCFLFYFVLFRFVGIFKLFLTLQFFKEYFFKAHTFAFSFSQIAFTFISCFYCFAFVTTWKFTFLNSFLHPTKIFLNVRGWWALFVSSLAVSCHNEKQGEQHSSVCSHSQSSKLYYIVANRPKLIYFLTNKDKL